MVRLLPTLFLAAGALLFPSFADAAFVLRRQAVPLPKSSVNETILHLDSSTAYRPYRSNWAFDCNSGLATLTGLYPDFRFDLIQAPFDSSNTSNQRVLESLGSEFTNYKMLKWKIGGALPDGVQFVERLMDSQGNARYSTVKKVRTARVFDDARRDQCDGTSALFGATVGIAAGVVLLFGLCVCVRNSRREARIARANFAVAGNELGMMPVAGPAPLLQAAGRWGR